jgi:hypothetical protein
MMETLKYLKYLIFYCLKTGQTPRPSLFSAAPAPFTIAGADEEI